MLNFRSVVGNGTLTKVDMLFQNLCNRLLNLNCHLNASCQINQTWNFLVKKTKHQFKLLLGRESMKKISPILQVWNKYFHQDNKSDFQEFVWSSNQSENCNWPIQYFILIFWKSWIQILLAIYIFFINIKLKFKNCILNLKKEVFTEDMNCEL